jgi:hypothetical protein
MRSPLLYVPALAMALSACGAPKLALPADPIGKAATCGVVAAADARAANAQQVSAPLSFDRQGQIIHYALLAGAEGDKFSREKAAAVVERMQAIQEDVTDGKWQALVQPCEAAYPEASSAQAVALPSDPLEAEMSCYTLGKFMVKALAVQGNAYEKQLLEFGTMGRNLDPKIGRGLDRRGIRSEAARLAQRDIALAKAAKLGSPAKVMDACTARYT